MEYKPRYTQPFTLTEAISLDVSIITEEIARLQNSLKHLRETQEMLRIYAEEGQSSEVDPEVTKAIDENEVTIGSQDERIQILKLALTEKGVIVVQSEITRSDVNTSPPTSNTHSDNPSLFSQEDPSGGIHL